MRYLLIIPALLLLAACAQPEPLCDRERQLWDKFGTQEDDCMRKPVTPVIPGLPPTDDPHDPCCGPVPPSEPPGPPPTPPKEPPSEPPSEPPTGKGNNGLGNGDQPAPGNSLSRNKAENQVGNPGHASGKSQRSD